MTPRGATIVHRVHAGYMPEVSSGDICRFESDQSHNLVYDQTFFNLFKIFAMRELQSTKLHGSPRRCVEEIMLRKGQKGRWPHHSRHIVRCGYFTQAPTSTCQGALHFGGGSWKVMSALRG